MKKDIVGINHLKQITLILTKASNLLNSGKDVLPYAKWKDTLSELKDEIEDHIILDSKLAGEE